MPFDLAIYTARHGMGWCSLPNGVLESEIDCARLAFGSLPDFDAGEDGFEGVAVCGGRAFVVRCFKAPKWDFMGRDSLYMAVTWMPLEVLSRLDVEALFTLRYFREPLRNPPTQFDFARAGRGLKGVADQEVVDGLVLRRRIGEGGFVKVSNYGKGEALESPARLPTPDPEEKAGLGRIRKWTTVLWWMLIVMLFFTVVVIFILDVFNKLRG